MKKGILLSLSLNWLIFLIKIQGLLHSISDGGCKLNGQVEAFIWFFARIVERRQSFCTVD